MMSLIISQNQCKPSAVISISSSFALSSLQTRAKGILYPQNNYSLRFNASHLSLYPTLSILYTHSVSSHGVQRSILSISEIFQEIIVTATGAAMKV